MLYSCTYMATVGVKGLTNVCILRQQSYFVVLLSLVRGKTPLNRYDWMNE